MATGNMYDNCSEVCTCHFSDMQADRQTHRHQDRNTLTLPKCSGGM